MNEKKVTRGISHYRYVAQNTTQFCIIHILCHKYISWTIIVFWKGFPCSFSSCGVLRLDLAYSGIFEA